MAQTLSFTKMQGCGNDYVYVNGFEEHITDPESLAKRVSDRHFGIGSDGLVLILPSNKADVRMRMFNPDGSEAQMCGNATRCVARYAFEHGLVADRIVKVETGAGVRVARLLLDGGRVTGATVDMGAPILEAERIPVAVREGEDPKAPFIARPVTVLDREVSITAVSMGNPHAVIFLGDGDPSLESLDLPRIGPVYEHLPLFPERVNTEFVRVESPTTVSMRVWERGTGETLACGTGACATAVACFLNKLTDRTVQVKLRGGTLQINFNEQDGHVYMTGPAEPVFEGKLYL